MEVYLTPELQAFIREAINVGRIKCEEDAVLEALGLWEQRERERAEFRATLEDAAASIDRGEGIPITQESMRKLAGEVKRRGLARLTTDQTP